MSTHAARSSATAPLSRSAWFAAIAGLSGSLVSIGLARFVYGPLIPPLISAHWFSSADTVTLGAANFLGYLVGAILGRPMAALLSNRWALRLMMLAATAAFFACAYPLSVTWYFAWRFLSGLSGGTIMVLVATTILPHIPLAKRGFVGGLIFVGIGLAIAASGTLIPELLRFGLRDTWIGLGVLALLLTAISWFGWPASNPAAAASNTTAHLDSSPGKHSLWVLYAQYAANALGLVPVMVLLVDYIARGLGRGAHIGAVYWVVYGLAAIVGPVVCGHIGDRIGFRLAYRMALLLQAAAVGVLAFTGNPIALGIATALLGMFTPGIVPLVLGRIHDILPNNHTAQRAAWSQATTAFALFQAAAGYGYAFLFSHTGENYEIIFLCAMAALIFAMFVDFFVRAKPASL